jgi:hypothetical protein
MRLGQLIKSNMEWCQSLTLIIALLSLLDGHLTDNFHRKFNKEISYEFGLAQHRRMTRLPTNHMVATIGEPFLDRDGESTILFAYYIG